MKMVLDLKSVDDYRLFLAAKTLPRCRVVGRELDIPDEYAHLLLRAAPSAPVAWTYKPHPRAFDYQRHISALAIRKRKFAVFMEPGYGKTLIDFEFANAALDDTGKRILLVCPKNVIKQMLDERDTFYGDSLTIDRIQAAGLAEWLCRDGAAIGITNYEAIREGLPRGNLGGLILSECFPKGTKVEVVRRDKTSAWKDIESVCVGDRIANASGVDTVAATYRREVPYAVRVNCGGKTIYSSPNHQFFTGRGWVRAEVLEPGDCFLETAQAVRMVRGGVQAEETTGGVEAFLRKVLLRELADEPTGTQGQGSHAGSEGEDRRRAGQVACEWNPRSERGTGANTHAQPDVGSACSGEGESRPQADSAQAKGEMGRKGNQAGVGLARRVGAWVDGDGAFPGREEAGLADPLQTRLCQPDPKNQYRGGRHFSPQSQGEGPAAGCPAGFHRVDRVEVLEPRHPELDRFRDAGGKLYFYDLGATRHPSYSVEGFLVHNSSMLKSHYGKWGLRLIELGRGLRWKLCETGTPAPNDRIEYANHAVFLDAFPTVNSFLARFFVNRGQTCERWELKPHALGPFYRALSDWCIFVSNPATYGWKDNTDNIPPIHVHIDDVPLTEEQRRAVYAETGRLHADSPGGITSRSVLARIGKGTWRGKPIPTNKPEFIRALVNSWPDESTLLWCIYNGEQDEAERLFPNAASLHGRTPDDVRQQAIDDFKAGRQRILISKAEILGFGLNLQRATRQVFSGLEDSYENYWQCVKRSNRVGSTLPLNVHIPVTECEHPMVETVLHKARRVQQDTEEQERLFKENSYGF